MPTGFSVEDRLARAAQVVKILGFKKESLDKEIAAAQKELAHCQTRMDSKDRMEKRAAEATLERFRLAETRSKAHKVKRPEKESN